MSRPEKASSVKRRYAYNESYQKQYVKRYVFKLNTRHDRQLIEKLEKMENRTEWFKEKLRQEAC